MRPIPKEGKGKEIPKKWENMKKYKPKHEWGYRRKETSTILSSWYENNGFKSKSRKEEFSYSLVAEVDSTRFYCSKLLEFNIKLRYRDIQREIFYIDWVSITCKRKLKSHIGGKQALPMIRKESTPPMILKELTLPLIRKEWTLPLIRKELTLPGAPKWRRELEKR